MSATQIVNLCLHWIIQDYFNYLVPLHSPRTSQFVKQIRLAHRPPLNIAYQKYLLLSLEFDPDSSAFHKNFHYLIHLYLLVYLPCYPINLVNPNHNYYLTIKLNRAVRSKDCCFRKNLPFHCHSHLVLQYFRNYRVMHFICPNHL